MAELLERDLLVRYGTPLLGGDDLRSALGYPSVEALRQAISRGTVPVPIFSVEHRRGKFALTKDVAAWLAALRQGAERPAPNKGAGGVPPSN
ncbi:hypothetical protein HDE76_004031 [Rhodanobacter sp. ANJX3]|uniref:hypothetical protein n=1 Tax=Rhodanobacter sp. ANJX3 TaxID=2723083 RepID=UPI00182B45BA|nr:hypothetical protein [Rhodanobacter sp. ANJX3]MBB5360783.1 hypothetical protein [Rhodanobacter sp. ANJX3]